MGAEARYAPWGAAPTVPGMSDNTILCSVVGSHLYGLATESSDLDEMAVEVATPYEVLNPTPTGREETRVDRPRPADAPSRPGDLERVTYTLRKYLRLAASGNPHILQILWAPPDLLRVEAPEGAELRRNRRLFVTRRALSAFLGYATQQAQRLKGERGQKNVTRRDLVERHGYDTKYAYHVLRLAYMGESLVTAGELTLPLPAGQRRILSEIRDGAVPRDAAYRLVDEAVARLETLRATADLPDVDVEAVGRLSADLHLSYWRRNGLV